MADSLFQPLLCNIRWGKLWSPGPAVIRCAAVGKLHYFSVAQFPHMENGGSVAVITFSNAAISWKVSCPWYLLPSLLCSGMPRTENLCPKSGHVRTIRVILRKTGTDSEDPWVGIKLKASVLHRVLVWQDAGFSRALCRVKSLHPPVAWTAVRGMQN